LQQLFDFNFVYLAQVRHCWGSGSHVLRSCTSTTPGVSSTTDPDYSGTVQKAPGPAFRSHSGKSPDETAYRGSVLLIQ